MILAVCIVHASPGEVIPYGSQIYEDMDVLFILDGRTIPSATRPWTKSEALNELSKINASELTGVLKDMYLSLKSQLEDGPEHSVSIKATLSPEIYVHTNEDFNREDLWVVNYLKRRPLLTGAVEAFSSGFGFHTELSVGVGRATKGDNVGTVQQYVESVLGKTWQGVESFLGDLSSRPYVLSSDVYGSLFRFNLPKGGEGEVQTPRTAWLVYAWKNGSVGVYRDKKVWGKTQLGSYVYDEHIHTYDYLSAKFYNRVFNFDFTVMFPSSYLGGSSAGYSMEYQRVFLSHRLSVQFSRKFNFTLSENVMYWLDGGFEPLFTNPALIYHNNIECNLFNALAHIELEYVPIRGLRLYGQLGVDQGSVPAFEDAATEDLAAGLTIGAQYVMLTDLGILDFGLEGAIVTPAMYRRGSQYPDFAMAELAISNSDGDYNMIPVFSYIGFPLGGDVVALKACANIKSGKLSGGASTTLLWRGEQTIFDVRDHITSLELTGNVSFGMIAELKASYDLDLIKGHPISIYGTIDGVLDPVQGFDVQLSVGASISVKGALFQR